MIYQPKFSPVYDRMIIAASQNPSYILSEGGTRSGKTFAALQLLYFLASKDKEPSVNSVVSETFPHLKRGAMRDFRTMFGSGWDEKYWSKSESVFTCPTSGSIIEFFSADTPSKVHGPARKRLFLNEIQNIDYETARQLFVRTEGLKIMDYNPTGIFWAQEKIEPSDRCIKIHSTYKDNPFLSAEQVREIESNKDSGNWWRVYGLGLAGQLEGLIFPDFEQIDRLPDGLVETYGLDFGFTNDPSVLIHTKIDTARKAVYFDEVFYQTGMLNSDIADAMKRNGVPLRSVPIFADSAEPKTIAELAGYGYNVRPSYKATRKAEQLQTMKGYRHYITKRSLNLIREHRGYTWDRDRSGHLLAEPIAINDHAEDAARYSICSWLYEYQTKGIYNISIR